MAEGLVRVLPDTNVCYPISVLDLILRCDEQDLHRVVWTDDLLGELVRVWIENGARSESSARSIASQIRATFPKGEIERGRYEHLVDDMPGKDPDDHPHSAAAVAVAPSVLLTANLDDFPAKALGRRKVAVRHPDDYFADLLADEPEGLLGVLAAMAEHRHRPPTTVEDILDTLHRAGLPCFAAKARQVWLH